MNQTQRKARLAFIGCGGHCSRKLLPSTVLLSDLIDLAAVCDLQKDLADKAARLFGARASYNDVDAMLDAEELDGVCIIGPPQMHSELGSRVLERGLPIFVEKPPGIDVETAVRLAQLADRQGSFGMVAFMKRFAVGYRMAKHVAAQEDFGGVQVLEARFTQGSYPTIWGLDSPAVSFLTGQVVHLFDLVRHFGGDVTQLFATYREVTPSQFGFLINVTFKSGAIGVLNLNTLESREDFRDFEERLVLAGTENQVTVDDMIYLRHQSKQDWISVPGLSIGRLQQTWQPTGPGGRKMEELIGFQGELEQFARSCLKEIVPSPNLWDGVAALEIGEAVRQSVLSKQPVQLGPTRGVGS